MYAIRSYYEKDANVTARRPLSAFAYAWGEVSQLSWDSHWGFLARLAEWGFPVNPRNRRCATTAEAVAAFAELDRERARLPYDIDA